LQSRSKLILHLDSRGLHGLSQNGSLVQPSAECYQPSPTATVRATQRPSTQVMKICRLQYCLEWHTLVTLAYSTPDSVVTNYFWATVTSNVSPSAIVSLSVLSVLSVLNVDVLWPNGWMDQDATCYRGRPRPIRPCVRWGPSSHRKGAQQHPPPLFGPACAGTVVHLRNCRALVCV